MTSQGMSIKAKADEAARVAFNKDPKTIPVPPAIQAMRYEGVEKALVELGLKRSSAKRCVYNNNVMKKKTKQSCKKHFEGMNRFLTRVGDWESLLILLEDRPQNDPPMKVDSVIACISYKCGEPKSILTSPDGIPTLDATGNIIECAGSWHAPQEHKTVWHCALCCLWTKYLEREREMEMKYKAEDV
jgi:hypothetical protein